MTPRRWCERSDRRAWHRLSRDESDARFISSDHEVRKALAGLVAIVRDRLPMRYYRGETWWSLYTAASLVKMADTVDSILLLKTEAHNLDAQTLLRSLYEQVVSLAWIGVDPAVRQPRWLGQARWEELRLHNDAVNFGERLMSPDEIGSAKKLLGIGTFETDSCGRRRRRKTPLPDRILPPLTDRAREADEYWVNRVSGLHASDHLLGFRGLYLGVYRIGSQPTHGSMAALELYFKKERSRYVVQRAAPGPELTWYLVAPLFGIALMIAAQQVNWIDEARVRELVDQATGDDD